MVVFVEAVAFLLPPDAGGRLGAIAPREGTYRPVVGSMAARFIEGPPRIEPGGGGRVVIELDGAPEFDLAAGSDLQIIEDDRVVGMVTVTRFWRGALAS
jgi:hypothetical protein